MTKATRIAALYMAVVFVAGGLFGFVAHGVYKEKSARAAAPSSPQQFRERYVAKLKQDLGLTPEQLTQVTAILDQTGQRFRDLRQRMDPEFDTIRQQQRGKIMSLLNEEQQGKYRQILAEWQKQHEKRR